MMTYSVSDVRTCMPPSGGNTTAHWGISCVKDNSNNLVLVHPVHLSAMRVHGTFLALSVFHPYVLGTTAFLFQAPKPLTSKGWKTTDNSLTPTFSYLGGLSGGEQSKKDSEGAASETDTTASSTTPEDGRAVRI
jgi:hypothetical protein